MDRIRISNIISDGNIGQEITVCGWIRTKRESKGIAFIALNDGSTQDTLQLVVPADSPGYGKLQNCNTGAAIKVYGALKESPGKGQKFEVEVSDIEVFGDADSEKYPLQNKSRCDAFQTPGAFQTPVPAFPDCCGALFGKLLQPLLNLVHSFLFSILIIVAFIPLP